MEREVFPSKVAGNFINEKVVFVQFDTDKEGYESLKKYDINAIPTFIIYDGDGKELSRFLGNINSVKSFNDKLEECLKPENYNSAREKRFNEDPSYAKEYLTYLCQNIMNEKADKLLAGVFDKMSMEEKLSKDWIEYYKMYVSDLNSNVFKYMCENSKQVSKVMGKNVYNAFMKDKAIEALMRSSYGGKEAIERTLAVIKANPIFETGYSKFVADNVDIIANRNMSELLKAVDKAIETCGTKTRQYIISFIDFYDPENKYMTEIVRICEKASQYEEDNIVKQGYINRVERMRKI